MISDFKELFMIALLIMQVLILEKYQVGFFGVFFFIMAAINYLLYHHHNKEILETDPLDFNGLVVSVKEKDRAYFNFFVSFAVVSGIVWGIRISV